MNVWCHGVIVIDASALTTASCAAGELEPFGKWYLIYFMIAHMMT